MQTLTPFSSSVPISYYYATIRFDLQYVYIRNRAPTHFCCFTHPILFILILLRVLVSAWAPSGASHRFQSARFVCTFTIKLIAQVIRFIPLRPCDNAHTYSRPGLGYCCLFAVRHPLPLSIFLLNIAMFLLQREFKRRRS